MKTVILAAGRWTRLRPITDDIPKPMVKVLWKPILEHILNSIKNFSSNVIIITKYKEEKIKEYFKDKWENINIKYKTQWDEKWTAAALWGLNINEDFVILNWDTIYAQEDLERIYKFHSYACLVKKVSNPSKYGIFQKSKDWTAIKIIEKPQTYVWDLANIWVYKFPSYFVEIAENVELSERNEYEITSAINKLLEKEKVYLLEQKNDFIDIWYPQDIEKAEKKLLKAL